MNDREHVLDACRAIGQHVERLQSVAGDFLAASQIWGQIAGEAERIAHVANAARAERTPASGDARKSLDAAAKVLKLAAKLRPESTPEQRAEVLRRLSAELRAAKRGAQ